jgi:molybdopterin converting factor small subunit
VAAEYADDDTEIPPGAEVAAIPPVSGGALPTGSRR